MLSNRLTRIVSRQIAVLFLAPMVLSCGRQAANSTTSVTPTVISVSPSSGTIAGGTSVTITGTAFQTGAAVTTGGAACTGVTLVGSTQITCTTPAHAVGVVSIVVTNPDSTTATFTGAYQFIDPNAPLPAPVLSSISPSSGFTTGFTTVTLTGSNFFTGATVSVDGTSCGSTTVLSATSISCQPAAHAAGAVSVTVTNTDTQVSAQSVSYTYVLAPTYTQLESDILSPICSSCHGGSGGLFVLVYSSISTFVTPGNPSGSTLYQEVSSNAMPQGGPPLSATQKQEISDWISAGALNN
jgi:hypothetical protein